MKKNTEHKNTFEKALLENDLLELTNYYTTHGKKKLKEKDIAAGCYYLTNAYICALEGGFTDYLELRQILISYGREE